MRMGAGGHNCGLGHGEEATCVAGDHFQSLAHARKEKISKKDGLVRRASMVRGGCPGRIGYRQRASSPNEKRQKNQRGEKVKRQTRTSATKNQSRRANTCKKKDYLCSKKSTKSTNSAGKRANTKFMCIQKKINARQRKKSKKPTEQQKTKAETTATKKTAKKNTLFVLKKVQKKHKQRRKKG